MGMDVTPFSGVKIQKVGAIYTRTLEEGGAIYLERGVVLVHTARKPWFNFAQVPCGVLFNCIGRATSPSSPASQLIRSKMTFQIYMMTFQTQTFTFRFL